MNTLNLAQWRPQSQSNSVCRLQTRVDKFWEKYDSEMPRESPSSLGEGQAATIALSLGTASWVTPQGHESIDLQKDPDFGPKRLFPYLRKHFDGIEVKVYPTTADKTKKRNGVVIKNFGTALSPSDWERYSKQNFFDLDFGGKIDFGSDAPWRMWMHSETCKISFIACAKVTRRKDEGSSNSAEILVRPPPLTGTASPVPSACRFKVLAR